MKKQEENESRLNELLSADLRKRILSLLYDISNSHIGHMGMDGKVYCPQIKVTIIKDLIKDIGSHGGDNGKESL